MTDTPALTQPIATDDIPWDDWSEGVRFGSRVRVLSNTRNGSGLKIGVGIEELPPGKQSSTFHYHLVEEEHMMILEGSATLRLGEKRYLVKAGDFVSFPAGQRAGHCLINEGDQPCRFLMIGNNDPNDVCIYPDSNKVAVNAVKSIQSEDCFDLSATRDYWDGEKRDEPAT